MFPKAWDQQARMKTEAKLPLAPKAGKKPTDYLTDFQQAGKLKCPFPKLNFNEPTEYEAEYYYSKTEKDTSLLAGLGLIGASIWLGLNATPAQSPVRYLLLLATLFADRK